MFSWPFNNSEQYVSSKSFKPKLVERDICSSRSFSTKYFLTSGDFVASCFCITIGFAAGFYFYFGEKLLPYIFGSVLLSNILLRLIFVDETIIVSILISVGFAIVTTLISYILRRLVGKTIFSNASYLGKSMPYLLTTILVSFIGGILISLIMLLDNSSGTLLEVFIKWTTGIFFGLVIFGTTIIYSYYYKEKGNLSTKDILYSFLFISAFIVVGSLLFSNTISWFTFEEYAYIFLIFYLILAFGFTFRMILTINVLYVVLYQLFFIKLGTDPDYSYLILSLSVYILTLSATASSVKMVLYELHIKNKNLIESTKKLESLVYSTESLLKLSDDILDTDIKIQEDYLKRIFNIACSIFDNYDYATCFIKEKTYVNFIDTVGYDKDVLNDFKFKTNTTDFVDVESPYIVHDGEKSVKSAVGEKYKEWSSLYPEVSEAIRFGIYIDEDTIAGMSFDILKDSAKSFNLNHLENYKSFQKLMNSFFSINYLNYKNISLKNDIVLSLIRTLELFDQYTGGHSEEVAYLSNEIAKRCGIDEKESHDIYWAGVVHDIGKVGIDSSIINKPSKLSLEEYEEVKNHSVFGYEILNKAEDLKHIAILVKYHHEWWNGAGYPSGLKGDKIPLGSQIISVCDAVSTMAKKRPYTIVKTSREIVDELKMYSGVQFSPEPAKHMIKFIEEGYLDEFYKNR